MTREEARELVNELVEVHTYGPNIEAINKVEEKIIAALAPAPAPDDEALIQRHRKASYEKGHVGSEHPWDDVLATEEALRRRIAELRARVAELEEKK